MKKRTLNVLFVLIIAIGGFYLLQPETAWAYYGDVCGPVEQGEDPCEVCVEDDDCKEAQIDDCVLLQKVGTDEFVLCDYDG